MKQSTKDQVQGKFHEVKGKAKEKVGEATDNLDLEQQGQVQRHRRNRATRNTFQ